jgi:hypothetical protein
MFLRRKVVIGLILGIILIATALGIYFFIQYQNMLQNPVLAARAERDSLTKEIGKLMDLPKDEEPTIATISDISKLKNQSFFAKAKNGDKLLIYTKAKKAILYDTENNKIIEVGPLNVVSSAPSAQPATVKVTMYNGTKDTALIASTEKNLKENIRNIAIVRTGNAAKTDYKKTLVIDLKGGKPNITTQLAAFLGGEVGEMPKGEVVPVDAEILVILGK